MYAELEIALHQQVPGACVLRLHYSLPHSSTDIEPLYSTFDLDFAELESRHWDQTQYATYLSQALWQEPQRLRFFQQVQTSVASQNLSLRVRIVIDSQWPQAQQIRWELLQGSQQQALASSERVILSRYCNSQDWRACAARPRQDLQILVAIAAADNLEEYGLAEIDEEALWQQIAPSLHAAQAATLRPRASLNEILQGLRAQPVQVLYLVAHGRIHSRSGEALLYLVDADNAVAVVKASALAQALTELAPQHLPSLIILASCASAGTPGRDPSLALAPLLAGTGVPAILAMQGNISIDTISQLMPVFFHELLQDGQIDRALAVARAQVRERADAWIPALFLRLKTGCLWQPSSTEEPRNAALPPAPPALAPKVLMHSEQAYFCGREAELMQLAEAFGEQSGLAVLSGSAGIGKSALASQFARQQQALFVDGFIGLRVDDKDAATLAREFARYLGEEIDAESQESASSIMQRLFQQRRMLLILDNANQVNYELIRSLLPGGACRVLITTRDRGLAAALDVPSAARLDLQALSADTAQDLLARHIGRARLQAEPQAAQELADLLGRLPLALKIAGQLLQQRQHKRLHAYCAALRLEQLSVRKDQSLDLSACFALSLQELNRAEEDFFLCLSACARSGFSEQTAAAAAACDPQQAEDYLLTLHQFSLLNQQFLGTNAEHTHYAFHGLLYEFAQQLAQQRGLYAQAEQALATYFQQQVKALPYQLSDGAVLEPLGREFDSLLLAARYLGAHQQLDSEFLSKLHLLFQRYGHWQDAEALLGTFLAESCQQQAPEQYVHMQIQRAKYLTLQGQWPAAESLLEEAALIVRSIREPKLRQHCEAMRLNKLGGIYLQQGQFSQAAESLEQSLHLSQQIQDLSGQAKTLHSLGNLYQRQGRFSAATNCLQASYDFFIKIGDQRAQAMLLNSLGSLRQRQGKFQDAREFFQRSIDLERSLNNLRGQAMSLNSLGSVLLHLGHLQEAAQALRECLALEQQLHNRRGQLMALNSLGRVLQAQGKFPAALELFEQAQQLAQKLHDEHSLAILLNSLSALLQDLQRFDEAVDVGWRSLELFSKYHDEHGQALALNTLGGGLQQQGLLQEAAETLACSVEKGEALQDQRHLSLALNTLGKILQRQGRLEAAEQVFRRSLRLVEQQQNLSGKTILLTSLGSLLQHVGRYEEAASLLQESCELASHLDDQRSLAMSLSSLGNGLLKQGHVKAAERALRQSILIAEQYQDSDSLGIRLHTLGRILLQAGKTAAALESFERSLIWAEKQSNQASLAMIMNSFAQALQHLQRFDKAAEILKQSIQIAEQTQDQVSLAMRLHSLGRLFMRMQRFAEAENSLRRALKILQSLANTHGEALLRNTLGRLLHHSGRYLEAEQEFERSIMLGQQQQNARHLAIAYTGLGELRKTQLLLGPASQAFAQAFHWEIQLKNRRGLAIVTPLLLESLLVLDELSQARQCFVQAQRFGRPAYLSAFEPNLFPHPNERSFLGRVKQIYQNKAGDYCGFIECNEFSADVYFYAPHLPSLALEQLHPGWRVRGWARQSAKGWQAVFLDWANPVASTNITSILSP